LTGIGEELLATPPNPKHHVPSRLECALFGAGMIILLVIMPGLVWLMLKATG
jgi:hypothetical protein